MGESDAVDKPTFPVPPSPTSTSLKVGTSVGAADASAIVESDRYEGDRTEDWHTRSESNTRSPTELYVRFVEDGMEGWRWVEVRRG